MNNPKLLTVVSVCKEFVRTVRNKHWNPGPKEYWNRGIPNFDWRRARGKKVSLIKDYLTAIEDYRGKNPEEFSPEERRSLYKERGVAPMRDWNEETIFLASSSQILDPYVPPEGDGKASILSVERSKQESAKLKAKGKSMMALKKIRTFLEYFDPGTFGSEAMEIYLKAHQCLVERDSEKIFDYVTEKAYPEMTRYVDHKTLRWKLIKSNEPPRVVHVRNIDGQEAGAQFGQVTVRFNTAQTLAIYDSFGRLIYGDEAVVKNVIEYVVFENHLSNVYGKWRIHGKIIPDWLPSSSPISQTFVKPDIPSEDEIKYVQQSPAIKEESNTQAPTDGLATA
ncbi:probable 39S ribosomal protein L45, mitochondrial [Tetranychus urticae]|uniref:Large ribosomal subunit protein mL45 n=1 Tax=Tetranychus urticae TaxID=32264 RepID=T1KN96_TETUR|nr:probable 39S ribosomal protein L45, mitochondrial [Tetranychus urticae]